VYNYNFRLLEDFQGLKVGRAQNILSYCSMEYPFHINALNGKTMMKKEY